MRKYLLVLFLLLTVSLCLSANAETLLSFDSIHAQITLDDSKYIILTPDNLEKHQEWMSNRNITPESLLEDWNERGVLLQAWTLDSDACLELTAVHDEWSDKYFDLDQQTKAIRASYRSAHLKGTIGSSEGYKYQSA